MREKRHHHLCPYDCSEGTDVYTRAGKRKIPRGQLGLVGSGAHCVAQIGQHSSYPTAACNLHHLSLQSQHTGGAIWFPTNTTEFIFARLPASLAFQKIPLQGLGEGIYPKGT